MHGKDMVEELASIAHLHPKLTCMAWKALSVESKLRLYEGIARNSEGRTPPEWLVDLILEPGEADFVRFWVVKDATLNRAQAEKVAALDENLIKISLPFAGGSFFRPMPPHPMVVGAEGLSLFWRYRVSATSGLSHLVSWLTEHENDDTHTDDALHASSWGFLSRSDVQDLFRSQTDNWLEMAGDERAGYYSDVKAGWSFLKSTRRRSVAMSLVYWTPTYTLALEEYQALPEHLQRVFAQREWVTPEVRQFALQAGDADSRSGAN